MFGSDSGLLRPVNSASALLVLVEMRQRKRSSIPELVLTHQGLSGA
jgi:hypothetical protein